MTSFTKRLNRKWKKRKWIDTSFADSYKRQKSLIHIMQAAAVAQGHSTLKIIAYSNGNPILRKVAIAESIIATQLSVVEIGKKIDRIPGPYRGEGG